jgi:hypothetical protein
MKKIILASLLMMTGSVAFAQAAATACSTGTASSIPGDNSGATYIRVAFKPVCSANSVVRFTDSVTSQKLYGGSASVKGASYFGGSTQGGAIQRAGGCANAACGDATAAAANADTGMGIADGYGASS